MNVILGIIFGGCMASFAYCMAWRMALNDHTLHSYCPYCRKALRWYDLIPVAGYLWQKGRCRYCHHPIPPGSFFMELLFGILGGYRMASDIWEGIIDLCLFSILLWASVYDRMTFEIPDYLHLSGVILFLLSGRSICHGYLLGIVVWMIARLYAYCRKTVGFGDGDCKLLVWLGLFFTIKQMCVCLLAACCGGMVYGFIGKHTKIAFAPFVFIGILMLLFLPV